LEGLKEVQAAFDKKLKQIQGYTKEAITDVTLDLTGKAVLLAPVDTGDLRGSGQGIINKTVVAEGNKDGSISHKGKPPQAEVYNGMVTFTAKYAVRQHEEMEYNHPQGGQAKYLEQPFKENTDKYIKHLADSVKKAVE
jgi:hypothetical protein